VTAIRVRSRAKVTPARPSRKPGKIRQKRDKAVRAAARKVTVSEPQEDHWYHGTRYIFQPGDRLEGGRVPINQGFGGPPDPHVYYTTRPEVAREFAQCARDRNGDYDAPPRVYQVRPDRTHERDPVEEPEARSYRARSAEVVREVRSRRRSR
jgi:hypothetical protein